MLVGRHAWLMQILKLPRKDLDSACARTRKKELATYRSKIASWPVTIVNMETNKYNHLTACTAMPARQLQVGPIQAGLC